MTAAHDIDGLLTAREREVLRLMAAGRTNGQIADALGISFSTAKTHVSDIISRLGVTSREEAVHAWQQERRPSRRLGRALQAVLPGWLGAKPAATLLAGTALASVAAIFVTMALPLGDDGGPPDRFVVPLADLQPGTPRQYAVPGLGTDTFGQSIPLWVVALDGGEYHAFLGRDPWSNCLLEWRPDYTTGIGVRKAGPGETGPVIPFPDSNFPSVTVPPVIGAFKAYCGGWVFLNSGPAIFGATPRGLDEYPVRREGDTLVVTFDHVQLGACRDATPPITECSMPGQPRIVATPPPPVIADYAGRVSPTAAP